MADLNSAIQLIREGRKQEAQRILEPMLEAEPANIPAWFWYVETYPSLEKRIRVLEMCLNLNPGNVQVAQALQTLRKQRPTPPPPAQPPQPAETPSRTPYSSLYEEPKSSSSASAHPYFDEKPVFLPVETGNSLQSSRSQQKKPWEEPDAYVDNSTFAKPKTVAKSYAFYEAWTTVLMSFDIESYENVLNDPEAGAGRGFEWIVYAGIISGLLAPLTLISNPQYTELMSMPEFSELFGNINSGAFLVAMALVLALVIPIASVINLAINAGILNVLALLFGGNGYYGRTVYAIAAFLAPMTILIALLGVIPIAGQCLTALLGLYNIILNVRALRAAHSISTWQALGVMLAPSIIIFVLGCLILYVASVPAASG
jgi:hypothetical protein